MFNDLRQAFRFLTRNRGFAVAAAATLALGIGANSAMFTVVHEVLLRPLPYPEPDRLVQLWEYYDGNRNVIAPANYYDWISRSRSFASTAAYVPEAVNLSELGEADRIQAARVSTSFFGVLGATPLAGRDFVRDDETSGARIAIVRDAFWRTRLGADRGAIGRTVHLDGAPFEIIGVVPDSVDLPSRDTQVWRVLRVPAQQRAVRGAHYLQAIGRLAPGVTLAQAHDEIAAIGAELSRQHPQTNARVGAAVFGLHDELSRGSRRTVLLIFAATGVLLLLACVNVSHLLLARSAARRAEIAVRAALGATRARLARQLIVESLVLAFAGAAAGVLIAMWTTVALRSLLPDALADVRRASVDLNALGFTALVATFTALLFGLVPALRATSVPLAELARTNTTRASARSAGGRALIVLQVALAAVLVVCAGLLVSSFARLSAVDPGFDTTNLVVARVPLAARSYEDGEARRRFFRQLLDRLQATAGVETAAAATRIPLRAQGANMTFTVDTSPAKDLNGVTVQEMSPELIAALRLRVLRGRGLEESDRADAPVALVSRSFARRTWNTEDVLGRRVRMGPTYINEGLPWLTVVGVLDDVKQSSLAAAPGPQVYVPYGHSDAWAVSEVVVRSALPPATVVSSLRSLVKELDRNQPITGIYTMNDVLRQSTARPRFNALLVGAFATLALALAIIGVYGVIAYGVAQRTREIGVRVALGARRGDVLRLIGGQGMRAVLVGLGLGLASSVVLTRFLEGMLYEIEPLDPATYLVAAALMLVASGVACVIPTVRATRVDPSEALRTQ